MKGKFIQMVTGKVKGIFTILFVATIGLCSCGYQSERSESLKTTEKEEGEAAQPDDLFETIYRKISAEEAMEIMKSRDHFILLDVRTQEEFVEKRIKGAILIPDYEITKRAESELTDKNARILIYCRSGRRSENAARELINMGYKNVYDFGGIMDWKYETISGY